MVVCLANDPRKGKNGSFKFWSSGTMPENCCFLNEG